MKTQLKTGLIILTTLILGIVIGAMVNRAFVHRRIQQTFTLRNPALFNRPFMEIIRPTPEQHEKIRSILDRHSKKMIRLRNDFQEKNRAAWMELWKDLDKVLTVEQKMRLNARAPGRAPRRELPPRRRWRGPEPSLPPVKNDKTPDPGR